MESILVGNANDADNKEDPFRRMDLVNDDCSDDDSEASVTEGMPIIFLARRAAWNNFR
jgi:hypothetical protein